MRSNATKLEHNKGKREYASARRNQVTATERGGREGGGSEEAREGGREGGKKGEEGGGRREEGGRDQAQQ